ncbi:MAG: hypothetical protein WCC22_05875 [Terriglobales bacterium]
MKYLRYLTLVGLLMLPLAYSQAQVRVGVGIGFGPGYVATPVCPYGYYSYYPYACAPYGFYGPSWFVRGVFIGAGPWYHGWGRPYYGRPIPPRPFEGRGPFVGRGFEGRGPARGSHGGGDFHGGRR